MPELDGVALATAIRGRPDRRTTPVVILSSLGVHERATDVVAAFLVKPVKPSALHDTLATVLAGQRRRCRSGRRPASASTTGWARAIRCASCSPRTTR